MKYKALVRDGHHAYVYDIWEYINLGDWWYKQWLVTIGPELFFIVEADSEEDAIDALVDDGRWNHLIAAGEDDEWATSAGNSCILISDNNPGNELRVREADYVWAVDEATGSFMGFIFDPRDLANGRANGTTAWKIATGIIRHEGEVHA